MTTHLFYYSTTQTSLFELNQLSVLSLFLKYNSDNQKEEREKEVKK